MTFSQKDLAQIKVQGLTETEVLTQIENFRTGFAPMNLKAAAKIDDGIKNFTEDETEQFISLYDKEKDNYSITKFVPASGAATRMMKDLYNFVEQYKDEGSTPLSDFPKAEQVIKNIKNFAFYNELNTKMQKDNLSIAECIEKKAYKTIIEYILLEKGLNYGKSPKAWILFHSYEDSFITPFEEHLIEAAKYCSKNGEANIEFTILKEHSNGFKALKDAVVPLYEKKFGIKYNITFSFQQHSTDTIAVDLDNEPIHDKEGCLVFRPAGHGALITNINKLDSDIVFIKNIDNVSATNREDTIKYKKLLAGVLINAKKKVANLQNKLSKPRLTKQELVSIATMIKKQVMVADVKNFMAFPTLAEYRKYLINLLDRPIRVCGMVKNEGEPGGGPFFVESNEGISLQIVEKAQVNLLNKEQEKIFQEATHFNPVDIVMSAKSSSGKKYQLSKFVDYATGFISEKSFEGQTIKAQELPGLWNGSMAKWLTIFVQVPLTTFTPVKTINDLLKDSHQ